MDKSISIQSILAIFLGGGIGSVFRYLLGVALPLCSNSSFPIHTLIANVVGCFVIGFLFAVFSFSLNLSQELKLFLTVGFCGGLTTFSTFSLDIITLYSQNKMLSCLYVTLSLILGVLAVVLGIWLGGSFARNAT